MTAPLARVGDVIAHGQAIPANVVRMRDADGLDWTREPGGWRNDSDRSPSDSPLTVVEVDPEPQPARPEPMTCWSTSAHAAHEWDDARGAWYCTGKYPESAAQKPAERKLIGPAYAHLDAPCNDTCYEPAGARDEKGFLRLKGTATGDNQLDVPTYADLERAEERANAELKAVVKILDAADVDSGSVSERVGYLAASELRARSLAKETQARLDTVKSDRETIRGALELRKQRCRDEHGQPAESGPITLSLPQVPDGAVALVFRQDPADPIRFTRTEGALPWRMVDSAGMTHYWALIDLIAHYGPVEVVMREPRTWPQLESAPDDLPAHVEVDGMRFRRCLGADSYVHESTGGLWSWHMLRAQGEVREVLT